ncbi:hypothetical protein HYALB_00007139 [Hymenoscyphus albidus]|uniref:Lethal giant larvae (Lgl)-like C-terminal domain-containing protein n=1 Tax=Hymenoscyphus albidus TaxID=595503 RepID=A0A9N9LGW5_9HELO|nr:hypothetical protein HYALB_00007139 [Hymenoscyphus albidus]
MASFLRGKQAGIQNDLSAGILPGLFSPDDRARFGINSQIGTLAYDPVQSLLAVGTTESAFGGGTIYVFGQARIQYNFTLPRRASVKQLHFVADRLISLDSKNEIIVWDLQSKQKLASFNPPGVVTALVTDPMLDWIFTGLQNGEVVAFDLASEKISPLRLPNYWKERSPRSRVLSVVSMQLHPRDIGQLLIGYTEGIVTYSFKRAQPLSYFEFDGKLRQVFWHPTGTFIGSIWDHSTMVFFDPKDGRIVMKRTVTDAKVDPSGATEGQLTIIKDVKWCCKENPDDTGILYAGAQGMTFLELGPTPVYATSSWEVLETHLKGKKSISLATPPGAEVKDFCLIPRTSPHFDGAQDPIAILAILTSGELITMSFPSGYTIPPKAFHPSLFFVHPFALSFQVTPVDRGRWLGMVESRQEGPRFLKGGAEGTKPLRRYESRNIVQSAHGDGTIRIFDVGHGDELENNTTLQVDICRALDRYEDVNITSMSMGIHTGEFGVGLATGEVALYHWGSNKFFGQELGVDTVAGGITDISSRAESTLKEGLQPFVLYDMASGPIRALKMSEVGFVGVGSENGVFSLIDLRGPTVFFTKSTSDFIKAEKRSSFMRKGSKEISAKPDWPVVIEFGVMTLEGDNYSSIACFVGTNQGKVVTFKILPQANGGYTAQLAGVTSLDGRIVSINPIVASTGKPASATGTAVAALRDGQQTNGTLVVATQTEARIFKPATAKGAHKSWDDIFCESACVTDFEGHGISLVGVFSDKTTRAYSLPALKEITSADLPMLDKTMLSSSIVTPSGGVFGWTGPSELAMLNVWGTGQPLTQSTVDKLYNPDALPPTRPTISNLQWISGTQYVSTTDLDLLIGGPDRPPSKRMMALAAEEDRLVRAAGGADGSARTPGTQSSEGWGDYMTRQLNERTQKLGIVEDSTDKMLDSSQGWADDVNKFVNKQKRSMLLGGITGKFF